jgi:predicted AAA+ superfamily ATPase
MLLLWDFFTNPESHSKTVKNHPPSRRHAVTPPRILRLLQGFPVVTVTGPRKSGKTTLVRNLRPGKPYLSLESPAQRKFARSEPADFLRQRPR